MREIDALTERRWGPAEKYIRVFVSLRHRRLSGSEDPDDLISQKFCDQTSTAPAVKAPLLGRSFPLKSVKTPAATTPALAAVLEVEGV